MLRRTLLLLATVAGLAACGGPTNPQSSTGTGSPSSLAPALNSGAHAPAGRGVAILLPMTGPNAGLAQAILNAARLALDAPGAPELLVQDTQGSAPGAMAAAQRAVAAGAGLILGPLTSAETAGAAQVAQPAGVAVLAFTNDPAQARPGVWTLGITPGQQVRRLVADAEANGQPRFAALLPDGPLANAMADALNSAAAGGPAPNIQRYGNTFAQINAAARTLSDYANRRGPLDAQIKAAKALDTAEGRRRAAELERQGVAPPNFDTLMLAATGEQLSEVLSLLPYYDIAPPQVHLIGPAQWEGDAARFRGMSGARYAAPDPAAGSGFTAQYTTRFGAAPPRLADLAYDAAAIARVAAQQGGFTTSSLTRPDGFAGVDGVLGLAPDGHVRRGLAVFEIDGDGIHMVGPAPTTLTVPGV
jgi:ABC-type branched-subunit amino acid transport system substrate-binding protein